MKAIAVKPETRSFGMISLEEPKRRTPNDVLIRILDVGVCGTDKEICAFEYGTPPDKSDHLVIGHESLGQVLEVGPEVQNFLPGDLVVPSVRRPCHHDNCTACRANRQDFCFTGDFTERGIKGQHGFMTERIVESASNLHKVPKALRDVGVLVEPLTIAQKAIAQLKLIQTRLPWQCAQVPGHTTHDTCHNALVLGAGPVGLLGAMALVNNGFNTWVYSRERTPNKKSALVESFGAHYLSSEEVSIQQLSEQIGNIDVVYEAVGASNLAFQVMSVLGTNGVFIFTGVPGRRGPVEVDTDALMRAMVLKNQVVLGTVNAGFQTFEDAIADLATFERRWPKSVRALITGRRRAEDNADLLAGKAGGIKNVLTFTDN